MNINKLLAGFSLLLLVMSLETDATGALLNSGFEEAGADATIAKDWTVTSGITRYNGNFSRVHSGGYSLQFDLWQQPAETTATAYQLMPASGGQNWMFSGYLQGQTLTLDSYVVLEMIFAGSGGNTTYTSTPFTANGTPDQWIQLTTSGEAPAGTTSVTFQAKYFIRETGGGKTVWFDDMDASLQAVPEPAVAYVVGGVALLAILSTHALWRKKPLSA
jgi:hypothetical protein